MHQIHPNVALVPLLRRTVADDLVFHLFSNDLTPDVDTELADFAEAGQGDYAPITVSAAAFTFDGVADDRGYLMAPPIVFVTGDAPPSVGVYGYYVTNVAEDELLACARFDGAPLAFNSDNPREVWPIMGDASRFAS